MNLPPLPEAERHDHGLHGRGYTEKQMREYGAICRKQALEDAIKLIEEELYPTQQTAYQAQYNDGIYRKVAQIRSLL